MKRALIVSLIAWACLNAAPAAHAGCSGQTGKTIFEDTFSDDSGGWNLVDGPKYEDIKGGSFVLHPNAGGEKETNTSLALSNLTFAASEGDYCVEFILPKPIAADNNISAGLMFLRQDKNNYYVFEVGTDKAVYLFELSNGNWSTIFTNPAAAVKLDADAVNSLRVMVKDGKLTLFLNDQQLKIIRAQIPDGKLHFGIYAQTDKPSDANPPVLVKSFKVTTGPMAGG